MVQCSMKSTTASGTAIFLWYHTMECNFKIIDNHNIIIEKRVETNTHYRDIIATVSPDDPHRNHHKLRYYLKHSPWSNPYKDGQDTHQDSYIIDNNKDFKLWLQRYKDSFSERRECIIRRLIEKSMGALDNSSNDPNDEKAINENLKSLRNITMPLGDLTHIPAKVVYLLKNIISSKRDEAKITAIIILQQISRNILFLFK